MKNTIESKKKSEKTIYLPLNLKINKCILDLEHSSVPLVPSKLGIPGDASGKEPTCQCRRCKR